MREKLVKKVSKVEILIHYEFGNLICHFHFENKPSHP